MFMDNFRFLLHSVNGQIYIPYMGAPEINLQMIAAHDIGVFAASLLIIQIPTLEKLWKLLETK